MLPYLGGCRLEPGGIDCHFPKKAHRDHAMKQAVQPSKLFELDADNLQHRGNINLAVCLGREIRNIRKRQGFTVLELAGLAGLSSGSLSKIENGLISPSLNTLKRLASALTVSVTTLLSKVEKRGNATYVAAGDGVKINQRDSSVAFTNEILGRKIGKGASIESFIATAEEISTPIYFGSHESCCLAS
jgi:transcriptional regulator with XRE-family HTH domain